MHSIYTMYMYTCSPASCILQISMSVNWRHTHAVPMPTALTQMVALTVHVGKALKEMGSTVQVCIMNVLHKHSRVLTWWHILLQTFRSVKEGWMIVIQMQIAQTPSEVTFVHATLDLLEMVICVQVSNENFVVIMQHCTIRHFSIWPKQFGILQHLQMHKLAYFLDIDECTTDTDNCHENGACNNTFGSFECTCNGGFEGDGVNCTSKTVTVLLMCIHVMSNHFCLFTLFFNLQISMSVN